MSDVGTKDHSNFGFERSEIRHSEDRVGPTELDVHFERHV